MIALQLHGCRRIPLADYLKGLGVLRLVAEQIDRDASARWSADTFVLCSKLGRAELVEFFARHYVPTPIVAPWNSGSGFFARDVQTGIHAIEASTSRRFAPYRLAIERSRHVLARVGWRRQPVKRTKLRVLQELRAVLADDAVRWFDAAVIVDDACSAYPPLLGTGGNDGRLDFSNNQMQRLAELLLDPALDSRAFLEGSLFDEPTAGLFRAPIGQLRPVSAGGANAGPGRTRGSLVNPWDFVLALEGALVFSAAVSRRLDPGSTAASSFPFTVRAPSPSRGEPTHELWLPMWSRPASNEEVAALFAEGRATISRRTARTSVDFVRAITTLGIHRGLEQFTRIAFVRRHGKAHLAAPIDRWTVTRQGISAQLDAIDGWLASIHAAARSRHATHALRRGVARVDTAVLQLCRIGSPDAVARLLAALAQVEDACARSRMLKRWVRPVPSLDVGWADASDDRSIEWRLAATLAAAGEIYMTPVERRGRARVWTENTAHLFWSRALVDALIAIAMRREAMREPVSLKGPLATDIGDLAAFIDGGTNDARVHELARALAAIQWADRTSSQVVAEPSHVPAVFAACRLAVAREPAPRTIAPPSRGITARLAGGEAELATTIARGHLRRLGLQLRCGPLSVPQQTARRVASALVFPVANHALAELRSQVVQTSSLRRLQEERDDP